MSNQLHPLFLQVDTSEDPSFPAFPPQHLATSQCEFTPILASPLGALVHIYVADLAALICCVRVRTLRLRWSESGCSSGHST